MTILIMLAWLHFVADFVLQSNNMAINKGKSVKWLSLHALAYGLPFLLLGLKFALVTAILHGLVDFVTSKVNGTLAKKYGTGHWFFTGIGFDQAVHMTILAYTYKLLIGR